MIIYSENCSYFALLEITLPSVKLEQSINFNQIKHRVHKKKEETEKRSQNKNHSSQQCKQIVYSVKHIRSCTIFLFWFSFSMLQFDRFCSEIFAEKEVSKSEIKKKGIVSFFHCCFF